MPQAVTPRLRQPENPKKAPIDYTRPPASVLKFTDTLFDTPGEKSASIERWLRADFTDIRASGHRVRSMSRL